MKDEKFKKLVIGGTVAAVLLLVFLVVFLIYQITALSQRRERIEYLQGEIARYEQIIASTEDEIEKYQARYWLEQRAAELDMILKNQ
ncbi:MAG TPA: hypothetical protein H9708_00800 [Candidatus Borkfalkia stercoripullorum]|nr:hypothetical protein [Candidatus Borkfalkia stercoripullorum]